MLLGLLPPEPAAKKQRANAAPPKPPKFKPVAVAERSSGRLQEKLPAWRRPKKPAKSGGRASGGRTAPAAAAAAAAAAAGARRD